MEEFENTPEFQALVVSATARPERRMGESVIPAETPQWKEVRKLARGLVETHPDQLPAHVYLCQAEANVNGFSGFGAALRTIEILVKERWDELQPAADTDDPDDPYYARVNLVHEISHQPDFLDAIYRVPLVSVKAIGEFSTRDLDVSSGVIAATDEEQIRCQDGLIRGAFAESDPKELLTTADTLASLPKLCKSIENVFAQYAEQPGILSLDLLIKRLEHCHQRFFDYAREHLPADPVNDELVTINSANGRPQGQSPSSILNSEMAAESFNAILLYYQRYEPSSPVRVLTANAREFINKSFFEVLQAMAPDSRENLPLLLQQLCEQPVSSLLSDSYTRYLAGEVLPVITDIDTGSYSTPKVVQPAIEPAESSQLFCGPLRKKDSEEVENRLTSSSPAGVDANSEQIASSAIRTRQQVLETLEDIESYFVAAEPSSPIPVIVSDIKKLVSKNFMDLLEDFCRKLPTTELEKG